MREPTVGWFCRALPGARSSLNPELPLRPLAIDTRTLRTGDTFWALRAQRDGHDFVTDAFARGAKAAVVETRWAAGDAAQPFRESLIAVDDPHAALMAAARIWRRELRCPVVGITGSNGKTSTKNLILHLLKTRYRVCGTPGNLNNEIGVPLSVLAVPADAEIAVIEMGASKRGDIAYLCEICAPTHGLVTSISAAHLEGFGSLETIASTKGELFAFVAASGTAFVPLNNPLCIAQAAACRSRIGFDFTAAPAGWDGEFHYGGNLRFDENGCAHFEFADAAIALNVPGRAAAQTALAALTVAHVFGIAAEDCAAALAAWESSSGRGRILRLARGTVIDDSYNANPASMRNALELLQMLPAARRVAILGDMNELGEAADAEHRALGADAAAAGIQTLIFIGRLAQLAAAAAGPNVSATAFADYDQLEPHLPGFVRAGDTVLVKGSRSLQLERAVEQLRRLLDECYTIS